MPFTVLPCWFTVIFHHGEAAVDLFFALSGLVIVNSLEHFGYRRRPFLRGRAWRLLPVYFAVLAIALVVAVLPFPMAAMPWLAASKAVFEIWSFHLPARLGWHLAAHLALLHGVLPQGVLPYAYISLLGPAWSLSTEWQFYIVMAAVMPQLNPASRLSVMVAGLMICAVLYHALAPHLPPFWQFSRAFLPDAAAFFALGVASAIWLRGGGLAMLLACLLVACGLGLDSSESVKAMIPLGWALVMLLQRPRSVNGLGRLLDSRAAQYLGAISYPLYLLNEPVQRVCAILIAPLCGGNARAFTILWLPAALIAPVLAAALMHRFLETPALRWGKRLEGGSLRLHYPLSANAARDKASDHRSA